MVPAGCHRPRCHRLPPHGRWPGELHADHLQDWFEAGAADGFWVTPDIYDDGIDAFVEEVVPILQKRGIYPTEYPGTTLRDNFGVPHQYGLDPRTSNTGQ